MIEKPVSTPSPPGVDPASTSLFLDFDGTLVELAERPDAVVVSDGLRHLLEGLEARFGGRLALVSGRSIAQLDGFLAPWTGKIALVGSHGGELRTPERGLVAPQPPEALVEASRLFAGRFGATPGVLIEEKTLGIAIHYRLAPQIGQEAMSLAGAFAEEHALELQEGKMMVEVRSAGHDKGSGIATLMELAPFAGSVPVFLGDDLTDEPGFHRCAALGGSGILVGASRPTAARYRLSDVAAVHRWLAAQ